MIKISAMACIDFCAQIVPSFSRSPHRAWVGRCWCRRCRVAHPPLRPISIKECRLGMAADILLPLPKSLLMTIPSTISHHTNIHFRACRTFLRSARFWKAWCLCRGLHRFELFCGPCGQARPVRSVSACSKRCKISFIINFLQTMSEI